MFQLLLMLKEKQGGRVWQGEKISFPLKQETDIAHYHCHCLNIVRDCLYETQTPLISIMPFKVKFHPFWMLYYFCASLSDVLMIPCVISCCFHVYELLPFKQAEMWPIWQSIAIKPPWKHWKLIGIWLRLGVWHSRRRLLYMSDFHTGWCHNWLM